MFKPEHQDKNIRDIIEGPPRMEAPKSFDELERQNGDTAEQEEPYLESKIAPIIPPEKAHRIAIGLLSNDDFIQKLKSKIAENIVRNKNITRLDSFIKNINDSPTNVYGFTKKYLADIESGNFMAFDLVQDGNDLALSFEKDTGDRGLRPLDDVKLADMLNKIFSVHKELISSDGIQEYISTK